MSWKIRTILLTSMLTTAALADQDERLVSHRGLVSLDTGRSVYVDADVVDREAPTVILLNGLTYETEDWQEFAAELDDAHLNLVRYDPIGQGRTVRERGVPNEPIALTDQANDLDALIRWLDLPGKVTLAGLSYGGAIALEFAARHPERVADVVLMAPYTEPMIGQDTYIRAQVAATRLQGIFNPLNRLSDDELFDYFLKIHIYFTYHWGEPSILAFPGKREGVFRMVQGARKWRTAPALQRLAKADEPPEVHLMLGVLDQYVSRSTFERFWANVPAAARGSRIDLLATEHKLTEQWPRFTAAWLKRIIAEDPRLSDGGLFIGDPYSGRAYSQREAIQIDHPLDSDQP